MLLVRKWKKPSAIDVFHAISELSKPANSNSWGLCKIRVGFQLFIFCNSAVTSSVQQCFHFYLLHWSPRFYGNAFVYILIWHKCIEFCEPCGTSRTQNLYLKSTVQNGVARKSPGENISVYFLWKEGAVLVTFFINSILNVISHWKLIRILQAGLLAERSYWNDIDQWSYVFAVLWCTSCNVLATSTIILVFFGIYLRPSISVKKRKKMFWNHFVSCDRQVGTWMLKEERS